MFELGIRSVKYGDKSADAVVLIKSNDCWRKLGEG